TSRYYSGETIVLSIAHEVDANHVFHHYTYSCGFLNLGTCDGQESTPHWVGLKQLPIDLRFVDSGVSMPASPAHDVVIADDQGKPTNVVSVSTTPFSLVISTGEDYASLTRGFEMQLRISDRLYNQPRTLNRFSCAGPPTEAVCSQS